ncbi:OsmC family protein [uncultured Gilvimarinus sp.]|uniref:OsmC family protein n=1 Tax=uncultured Gilvimarinus sp. TaxID=1689143 RepID=UPI0030EDD67F|tara:strand:+ start:5567 stop:5992 length:426 start_codon:yes stop_codon:yes gene_type:complete
MQKFATAHWEGGLKDGKGQISTESGALNDQPYGFNTRFEDKAGSNPEELLGAAHAGCFSMALSGQLAEAGLTADSIDTKATVLLEKDGDGFVIPEVQLSVKAKVPGADKTAFDKAANAAKEGCPLSKVLNAKVVMSAELVS